MTDVPEYALMSTPAGLRAVGRWDCDAYRCSVCRTRWATTVDMVDHYGTEHVFFHPGFRRGVHW